MVFVTWIHFQDIHAVIQVGVYNVKANTISSKLSLTQESFTIPIGPFVPSSMLMYSI